MPKMFKEKKNLKIIIECAVYSVAVILSMTLYRTESHN